MGKMAYFDGNSFLSSTSDIFSTIGRGNWEIRFKIKAFSAGNNSIFGIEGEYSGSPVYAPLVLVGGLNKSGRISSNLQDGSWPIISPTVIADNIVHYIKIKGEADDTSRQLYASIDEEEFEKYDEESIDEAPPDWDVYSGIISNGQWGIGLGSKYDTISSEPINNFVGLISEFELLDNNGNRLLYLPLTEDFLDYSGNNVPITNNGVVLVKDTTMPIFYNSLSIHKYSLINYENMWFSEIFGALLVGNGYIGENVQVTKCGMGIIASFIPPIPKGSQISAMIVLEQLADEYNSSSPKAKVIGYLGTPPETLTAQDYKDFRGTAVGGADNSYLTSSYEVYNNNDKSPGKEYIRATKPVQEIVNLDDVSRLLLFFDDHDGESSLGEFKSFNQSDKKISVMVVAGGDIISSRLGGHVVKATVGGNSMLVPLPIPVIISGDLSFYEGLTKLGSCLYFPNIFIEEGKQLLYAKLYLQVLQITGDGHGLGGEDTSIIIRAEKNNSPDEIIDITDYMTRTRTTESVIISDELYDNNQHIEIDITSVLNEVLSLGDVDKLNIYIEDNGSDDYHSYAFATNAYIVLYAQWLKKKSHSQIIIIG